MQILRAVAAVRRTVESWRAAHKRVALVPTMGNLHAGHLALVERATQLADQVVVSIFVNPLQFNDKDDYMRYPRTFEHDQQCLVERGVAMIFAPSVENIYPPRPAGITQVKVPKLSNILEGAYRRDHFSGVATVVTILFNIVQPHLAVFGEKDYQQLLVIRQMVADLAMPVAIEGVATVRDKEGLALSSRNSYLSASERLKAPLLFQTLKDVAEAIKGGRRDFPTLEETANRALEAGGFLPDYFYIRRAEDLAKPAQKEDDFVILAAGYLGRARLIDNMRVRLKSVR